jgi:Mrp family chromosome partitioning ATPase/capsular polysaccharide biosynthesis protein
MQADPAPLTLRDYLAPVLERRWLVLILVVAVTGAVYAYEARRPATYSASTKDYVANQGNPALGFGATQATPQQVADQATLLTSTGVAAQVARRIGYRGSPAALASTVTATPASNTDFITITASAGTPAQAARVANAFAQEFIAKNSSQQQAANGRALAALQQQLRQLPRGQAGNAQRTTVLSEIQQLQLAGSSGLANVTQVDPAQPPSSPDGRPAWEYALLAAIASLIGSVLLTYMLHRLDPRLRNVDKAAAIYGGPVLATLMHDPAIGHFVDGKPALSPRSREAFRELCVNLELAAPGAGCATVLVTSAIPGEGKSTVARNLALALSEAGRRVALVDADLRRPSLSKSLGVAPEGGLTDVLAGDARLEDVTISVAVINPPVPGAERISARLGPPPRASNTDSILSFIPPGHLPANPPALAASEAFHAVLEELAETYEIVVIDTTPLTVVSDAMPLLGRVDAVLLVARSGTTDQRSARHAADLIGRVPAANIVGAVVNDVPAAEASAYGVGYGYGYGYKRGYGYGNGNGNEVISPRAAGPRADESGAGSQESQAARSDPPREAEPSDAGSQPAKDPAGDSQAGREPDADSREADAVEN